jgi:hypothetical protein
MFLSFSIVEAQEFGKTYHDPQNSMRRTGIAGVPAGSVGVKGYLKGMVQSGLSGFLGIV